MAQNGKTDLSFLRMNDPLLAFERVQWEKGISFCAGVDEAGRGCLAGPVVASAVIFTDPAAIPAGINDSKKLSSARRMELRKILMENPSVLWSIGAVGPEEIDRINILQATWKAMRLALNQLLPKVQFALVDGNPVRGLPVPAEFIVKGDARSVSVGAASIFAKTSRDLMMEEFAKKYPEYGFEVHKGYGTVLHVAALKKNGPSPIHRLTFEPVRSIVHPPEKEQQEFSF